MSDERTERDDGAAGAAGAAGADERLVEFLRTADRPRQLASDVAAALDATRGRVRTRLQALADEGRVVRTDAEGTARWAVPERADEPEPDPGPEPANGGSDGAGPDEVGTGDPVTITDERDPEEEEGSPPAEDESSPPAADDPNAGSGGVSTRGDDAPDAGYADRTDVSAAASGPSGESSGGPSDGWPAEPATARAPDGRPDRRPGVVAAVALVAVLVLALAARRRLRAAAKS